MNTTFDVDSVRKDFPILSESMGGHPLVYLDNAATAQRPQCVMDATNHFYTKTNANVHRAAHALGEQATQAFEDARTNVKHFINAKDVRECIFVRGTTEAINLVANVFVAPRMQPGEKILLTEMEHHSNIVPWQLICQHTGAVLRVIPVDDDGNIIMEEFEKLLTDDAKFLAIGHISNAIGTVNPIKTMIKKAHNNGTLVLVDGAQGAAHSDVDVQDLDCDFYAFSGHKMYGPLGIGVLYGKAELLERSIPYQGGGEMITQVSFEHTDYQDIPYRFEAGTPNIVGAVGLAAAMDYLNSHDREAIAAYEQQLLQYATDALHEIHGFNIVGTAKQKASILSFVHGKVHAHDIGTVLSSLGIAVRSGHHCAMPLMDRFGLAATTRASFAFYNTFAEVDKFIEALKEVKEVFA